MLLQKRIHEWSKVLPLWQRDLLRRLASGPLDEAGQVEVLEILVNAPDAGCPLPLELEDLPADDGEHGCVELRGIRNLSNMNCLAAAQTLSFRPGLNVVFGDNGTGKSGYGRLVRRITRSGDAEEVLRDVFDPGSASAPQTADVDIALDDIEQAIRIDLAEDPDRVLSAVAVFDAARARVFLAKPNVIEHVPRPLQLLKILSQTQDQLATSLRQRAEQHRAAVPALPDVDPDTNAGRLLGALSAETDAEALIAEVSLSDSEKTNLEHLEQTAATIRADQSAQLATAARAQAASVRSAAQELAQAAGQLSEGIAGEFATIRRRLDDVVAAERSLADQAFADQRFEATGQGPWREMWSAAERFAEASGSTFPDPHDDAACPLCQQGLDEPARRRLQSFHDFVGSTLRQQAVDLEAEIVTKLKALPDLKNVRAIVHANLRGMPEEVSVVGHDALAVLERREEMARKAAAGEAVDSADRSVMVTELNSHADAQDALAQHHANLRDENEQQKVLAALGELRARTAVVHVQDSIITRVKALKAIARIDAAIAQLSTTKISNKLRELQELAITERLRKAVEHELRELNPVAGRIEITGQASKGATVIHLKLKEPCRAKVGNVLSDGEQRALALAFFLADVAISDGRSAVVLDDPVSSLDHERRAYVAERLVEESKRRQVIVFTHDMAFVQLLEESAEGTGKTLHGQTLQRAFHRVGMVANDLPSKMRGTAKQLTALRHRLKSEIVPKHKRQDPLYEQEADRWVADLRKAYDQLIEDTVLNGTVRRFSAHVRVRQLHDVKWTPEVAERIDDAMKQASPKAHHEPLALHPAPYSPTKLAEMLKEICSIHSEITNRESTAVATSSTDAPLLVQAAGSQS